MENESLRVESCGDEAVEWRVGATLLFRYVYRPGTPLAEATRPYAHPVCSLAGEVLTNFRPNDHPWHHGLSLTINSVSGTNFWGGPTYQAGDAYRWRNNHGSQHHTAWTELTAGRAVEQLIWRAGAEGERLLDEVRTLEPRIASPQEWTLRWTSVLKNVSGRSLALANYHSGEGLVGSHYSGLQFRGTRALLDDHGDAQIGLSSEAGNDERSVHGGASSWMEWRGQMDTSLRRVRVRFQNAGGPLHWFVRRNNPLAAFAFHFDRNVDLAPEATLRLEHELTFADE